MSVANTLDRHSMRPYSGSMFHCYIGSHMKTSVSVGSTTKGARVWLQGTSRYGWEPLAIYNAQYAPGSIIITRATSGRKVTDSKGGIIDLVGRSVDLAAQGHKVAHVTYTSNIIAITFSN